MKVQPPLTAAVTAVSNNYLPAARVLARSYRKHHPNSRFYVLLVDVPNPSASRDDEPFEVISLSDLRLPGFDRFVYRYSVMELNTALKPYVMEYLFRRTDVDQLLYIDPDILVFRPLTAIWDGFSTADILLTPHMRKPFHDDAAPSELAIIQSGVYNLGFLGLQRSTSADELLQWWQEKLYNDCVVDIARGVFVDQKWMDLVPGYFPRTGLIHDPAYNAAYWNLHERRVGERDGRFYVDDAQELAFFHFSGYSPLQPDVLSRHQNRHDFADLGGVRALCDLYGRLLIDEGYEQAVCEPYAFGTLPNGVTVAPAIRYALRHLTARGVHYPSPMFEPDAFCRYLCTPKRFLGFGRITPLQHALLIRRPDIAAAFPDARRVANDSMFNGWIDTIGRVQEGLSSLLDAFPLVAEQKSLVRKVFAGIAAKERQDLFAVMPDMFANDLTVDRFIAWVKHKGLTQFGLPPKAVNALRRARRGPRRILNLYFSNPDLMAGFPELDQAKTLQAFRAWLGKHADELGLTLDEIAFFCGVATANVDWLRSVVAVNNEAVREAWGGVPTIFDLSDPDAPAPERGDRVALLQDMVDHGPPLEQQARIYVANRRASGQTRPAGDGGSKSLDVDPVARQALAAAWAGEGFPGVNIAGYFAAPIGMGEAGRSVLRAASTAQLRVAQMTLPASVDDARLQCAPFVFGMADAGAAASITVANADSARRVRSFLPRHYWADRNIAYWLWETDRLPSVYRPATDGFDEIWTSSRSARDAIARTIDLPVHVLPLAIDLEELAGATAERQAFGLPQDALIVGYFFDLNSILERKNPHAVVAAFKRAFGADPAMHLLLKVNGAVVDSYEIQKFKALIDQDNITLMQATLPRARSLDLLKSLDIYCSLHRCEGFGLTCAEAMAMGMPVVATAHSGNMDFMDEDSARLTPAELFRTTRSYGPYPVGTEWADPDVAVAAEHLRSLADKAARQRLGAAAKRHIESVLSYDAVAPRVRELLSF